MGKVDRDYVLRRLAMPGVTQKSIAVELGVSPSTICCVVHGRTYYATSNVDVRKTHDANEFTYAWRPRPITVPAPNALPWVTRERLMAGR